MVDRANEEVQHRWKTLHKEIPWADVEPEAAAVLEFVRDREPLPWVLGPRGRTLSDAELAEIRERKDKIGRAVNRLLHVHACTREELRQGKEPRPYEPPENVPREPNYPPPDRQRSKAMPRPGQQTQNPPAGSQAPSPGQAAPRPAAPKQPAVVPKTSKAPPTFSTRPGAAAPVTPPKAEPAKAAQPPADPPQPVAPPSPHPAPPDDQASQGSGGRSDDVQQRLALERARAQEELSQLEVLAARAKVARIEAQIGRHAGGGSRRFPVGYDTCVHHFLPGF